MINGRVRGRAPVRLTRARGWARAQVFAPREMVFYTGESALTLFIVQRGLASRPGQFYGPNSYFGEVRVT